MKEGVSYFFAWAMGIIWGNLLASTLIWFFTDFTFLSVLLVLCGLSVAMSLVFFGGGMILTYVQDNKEKK